MRALDIGATGMLAQQMNVEVISNNIANMSTTGFKRQRAEFHDLLYNNVQRPGAASSDAGTIVPSGIQMGSGVKAAGVYRINEQGPTQITDNELDLAIQGSGYFSVEMPDGNIAYTRAGSFQLNQDGQIVTLKGFPLQPGLNVPPETVDLTVNESGEVLAKIEGQEALVNVGQIDMTTFANDAGLEALGDNLFLPTEASGDPQIGVPNTPGFGGILQGALESSNVDIVSEITRMITAQRAYEMNSKVIRTADEMMNTMNQMR